MTTREQIVVALIPGLVQAALHAEQWAFTCKPTLTSVEKEVLDSAYRYADEILRRRDVP